MIEGWYFFTVPLVLIAVIGGVALASRLAPEVLPAEPLDAARKKPTAKKPKLGLSSLLPRLGVSLFTGVIIVGIGFGAVFPVINRVPAPIVCGQSELALETSKWSGHGRTTINLHWFCVDESTHKREAVSPLTVPLTAGLIHAAVLFVLWSLFLLWLPGARRRRLARMKSAKVTIEAITKSEDSDEPWVFTLKVAPDKGAPFHVTVKKGPNDILVGRDGQKSWSKCQRGSHFRAEYDPFFRRRLYAVSTA